jgi:Domain of unknown function (DUF1905)
MSGGEGRTMTLRQAQGERELVRHTAPLWRWTTSAALAAWYFITIDGEAGEVLAATALMRRLEGLGSRGFGSIKVTAQIGETRWSTSLFPSKEVGGFMLPVKAAVRKAEHIDEGDAVELTLEF